MSISQKIEDLYFEKLESYVNPTKIIIGQDKFDSWCKEFPPKEHVSLPTESAPATGTVLKTEVFSTDLIIEIVSEDILRVE